MRPSFVFDQNKCTGCQACQLACIIENELEPDASWRAIHTFNERHYPGAPLLHISLACNHCAEPACMSACPALAYSRDSETGAVLIDQNKCIGCGYCTWACPYDAAKFDSTKGVISKCTFCYHRIKQRLEPACVALCPTAALGFELLPDDELINESYGFTTTHMKPAIKIIPLHQSRLLPQEVSPRVQGQQFVEGAAVASRITLRSEWSLALFTFLGAVLFALGAAAATDGLHVNSSLFLIIALIAVGLSTLHLGRKRCAWRAALNVTHSWLSREVVLFSVFVVAAAAFLMLQPGGWVWGWTTTLFGAAATFSMDRVYRYAINRTPEWLHSASVLLTGIFIAGVLALNPVVAGLAGILKLILYLWRKTEFARRRLSVRPVASAARLGLGFGLPLGLAMADGARLHWLVVACVLLGELIDRCEFYAEIDVMTPGRQMAIDLQRNVTADLDRTDWPTWPSPQPRLQSTAGGAARRPE
jgi:DMSO reductase iron-sulfur subunit